MKKHAIFHIIIAIIAFFITFTNFTLNSCFAAESMDSELGNVIEEEIEKIDFDELDRYLDESKISVNVFEGMSVKEIVLSIINGEIGSDIVSVFNYIIDGVKENFKNYLSALMVILVIVLLCVLFNKVKADVGKQSVEEIIYFVCFAVVISIIVRLSVGIIEDATNSIFSMQKQMNIVFPILLTIMTSIGASGTVAAFTPLIAFLSNLLSNLFSYVLLPIFSLVFVLSILNNLSSKTKFTKLIEFFNSLFKWIVGVSFGVFFLFFSMQGITASTSDGLSLKAAKFAVKNYVPLLGGYVSEGFEIVKAGLLLVRNSVGLVGIILMFSSIFSPLIAIAVFSLCLKFLAGVLEPLGDTNSVSILSSVGGCFKLLLTCLLVCVFMYAITIILIICSVSGAVV